MIHLSVPPLTVSLSHLRYQSLNPSVIPPAFVDNRKAPELLLGFTDLGGEENRIRNNEVLFTPTKPS